MPRVDSRCAQPEHAGAMNTTRALTPKRQASSSTLMTFTAIVFMIAAVVFMLTGNVGTGAAFIAIGAAFIAIGQDRSTSRTDQPGS